MMSNFICDADKHLDKNDCVIDKNSPFETFKTLTSIFTFGCNIPLFLLANNTYEPIEFPRDLSGVFPGKDPRAVAIREAVLRALRRRVAGGRLGASPRQDRWHHPEPRELSEGRGSEGDGPGTAHAAGLLQPVDLVGDGSTCPDAGGIGTPTAMLRAERSGGGDGRVYVIAFTANDGRGGTASGSVTVCVPHDMSGRNGGSCADSQLRFDSTVCPTE